MGLLLAWAGCGETPLPDPTTDIEVAPTVAVAEVTRSDLVSGLELAAEFRPYQEVDIHAKVSGYLKEIYVDVGDSVRTGQLVALLEVPELGDDLAQAQATKRRSLAEVKRAQDELDRAESGHEIAKSSYDRLRQVIELRPNLVAQQEVDEAFARARMAAAEVSGAKAGLSAAEQEVQISEARERKLHTIMQFTRITAPFSGVVTRRFADPGAMIQAGMTSQTAARPLVRLSQMSRLRLAVPVPEAVISHIRVGSEVDVRVPSLNSAFQGEVARFSGRLRTATRSMEVEIDVPNPDLELKAGMQANVVLTLDSRTEVLSIPIQAISRRGDDVTVLLVDDDLKLEERKIVVGVESVAKVEVLEGLEEGDLVVIGNRNRLQASTLVQPRLVEVAELEAGH